MINAYFASMFSPLHFESPRAPFLVQYMGYTACEDDDCVSFRVGPSYSVLIIF